MDAMTDCEFICPHCWQPLQILVARSDLPARLVEDCQVCCHPIRLDIAIGLDGQLAVSAEAES